MAINLAGAIGKQRERVDVFSGVPNALNAIGNDISAAKKANDIKAEQERNKAYDNNSLNIYIDALPKDTQTFNEIVSKHIEDNAKLYKSGATASEIEKHQREALADIYRNKQRFEDDKRDFSVVIPNLEKEGAYKYDFEAARNAILNTYNTTGTPMVKNNQGEDDFFASSELARGENIPSEKGTFDKTQNEQNVTIQGKPYIEMTVEEREKYAPEGIASLFKSKLRDVTGNFNDASKGYFEKDWNPEKQYIKVERIKNADGTGQDKVVLDEDKRQRDKQLFLSSRDNNLGDAGTMKYWRTLYNKAAAAGERAGYRGEKLDTFVEETVKQVAADDFDRATQVDIEKVKEKYTDLEKSRGLTINQITNLGGGKYQTKNGMYQVDLNKEDVDTREQQYRNFADRNYNQIIENTTKAYTKDGVSEYKARKKAIEYWSSEKGKKELRERFDKAYPNKNKKIVRVYPALTPKQDGSNPDINVVDSKGRTIAFTPSYYNIDEETGRPISIYGVENVKERNEDTGAITTVQKPIVIPYNSKNKQINTIAPELENVYKQSTGKSIDLSTDDDEKPKAQQSKLKEVKYTPPKKGEVRDGYKFLGGDPKDAKNYEKI